LYGNGVMGEVGRGLRRFEKFSNYYYK